MTKKTKKKKAPAVKPKMGRPPKSLDWEVVKNLCTTHHTQAEIAAILNVDINTLKSRCMADNSITFSQFYRKYLQVGKSSIRKKVWEEALGGNTTVLMHQARHILGQWDKQEVEVKVKPFIIENPQGGEAIKLGVEDRPQIEGDVIDVETIEQAEAARYDSEQELAREGEDDEYTKDEHDGRGQ